MPGDGVQTPPSGRRAGPLTSVSRLRVQLHAEVVDSSRMRAWPDACLGRPRWRLAALDVAFLDDRGAAQAAFSVLLGSEADPRRRSPNSASAQGASRPNSPRRPTNPRAQLRLGARRRLSDADFRLTPRPGAVQRR